MENSILTFEQFTTAGDSHQLNEASVSITGGAQNRGFDFQIIPEVETIDLKYATGNYTLPVVEVNFELSDESVIIFKGNLYVAKPQGPLQRPGLVITKMHEKGRWFLPASYFMELEKKWKNQVWGILIQSIFYPEQTINSPGLKGKVPVVDMKKIIKIN